jgi:hypothetical protein
MSAVRLQMQPNQRSLKGFRVTLVFKEPSLLQHPWGPLAAMYAAYPHLLEARQGGE